ncbi:hypothetical protein SLS62_003646 [Diatrype stigma]|uniref:F-box domain-containing protein n=1 Tax=Diatrype stigma TaxID=117547 RepID=A0AAN9YPR9_9PEZI
MRVTEESDGEELGLLEDKTEALTLRSKRTERSKKKQARKATKARRQQGPDLLSLPSELLLEILSFLRPSDVFALWRVSKPLRAFVSAAEPRIAGSIVAWRYACLAQCYRAPALLADVDGSFHADLQSADRAEMLALRTKPYYQHVQPPDPAEVCTCLTCLLRWSALCFAVDFAHWQDHLDRGEPLPTIPRGSAPEWNRRLTARSAAVVRRALRSPLWHARLLEAQLRSTVRSNRRQAANPGNKRRRFEMSAADAASGTDRFLERSGPPSFDFPFHRDNYYMLESYMPNRSWVAEHERWFYLPAEQHDRDVEVVARWAEWRRRQQDAKQTTDGKK